MSSVQKMDSCSFYPPPVLLRPFSSVPSFSSSKKWKTLVGRSSGCLNLHFLISLPLAIFITILLLCETLLYFFVRLAGRCVEKWAVPAIVRKLIRETRNTEDFDTYRKCMEQLDQVTGRDAWKHSMEIDPNTSDYDIATVRRKKDELIDLRSRGSTSLEKLILCVRTCLESQLCSTLHPALYSMAYGGTKLLSIELQNEVNKSIVHITEHLNAHPDLIHTDPELFGSIRRLPKHFGSTGLILSGGGTLGFHHFGVVEQLIRNKMLPRVICGTSAGSAVAAFACTRSEEEFLQALRDPDQMSIFLAPFYPDDWVSRLSRYIRFGHSMDLHAVTAVPERIFGHTTFLEAYQKSGKILCISVTRADDVRTSTVLNYENAPNVLIFSAVLASSAFPFLAKPLHLMEKNLKGDVVRSVEYSGRFFQDGSLRGDIPVESIRNQWGVKFVIASQVNPHVFPFLDLRSHGTPGQPVRGWGSNIVVWRGGFPLSIFEVALKEHLRFLIRFLALLEIVPKINGLDISSLAFQDYGGDVNLYPSRFYWPHVYILNNIKPQMFQWFVQVGRQMTFPRLFLLHGRMNTEHSLHRLAQEVSSSLSSTRASTGHEPSDRETLEA